MPSVEAGQVAFAAGRPFASSHQYDVGFYIVPRADDMSLEAGSFSSTTRTRPLRRLGLRHQKRQEAPVPAHGNGPTLTTESIMASLPQTARLRRHPVADSAGRIKRPVRFPFDAWLPYHRFRVHYADDEVFRLNHWRCRSRVITARSYYQFRLKFHNNLTTTWLIQNWPAEKSTSACALPTYIMK